MFSEVRLQDIVDIQWGDTKTTKSSYVDIGYLAYSATGPDGFLDKFDYDKDGVVLSAIGANCGSTFYASGKWSCIKNTIRIFPKNSAIDLKYFYYMTKAPNFFPIRGSAQPFISQTDIRELYVKIPEVSIQKKIGEVLYNLEQKITTNNALSKTLEDIAQTIFKSWFIDFDPVTAKMAGEKPAGMEDSTTALFPDSMEESELGLVPKGWKTDAIGNVLKVSGGTTPSTTNPVFWDGDYCWTTPKDLSKQTGLITTGSARRITEVGLSQISSGLLPINSVLMSCRAPIGYVSVNAVPTAVNQGFITLNYSEKYSSLYLVNWIRANMNEIINRAGGATFAEITRKSFREIPFLLPPTEILSKYAEITNPLLSQLKNLTVQNENLVVSRDLLLPRLISGDLQIPENMLVS